MDNTTHNADYLLLRATRDWCRAEHRLANSGCCQKPVRQSRRCRVVRSLRLFASASSSSVRWGGTVGPRDMGLEIGDGLLVAGEEHGFHADVAGTLDTGLHVFEEDPSCGFTSSSPVASLSRRGSGLPRAFLVRVDYHVAEILEPVHISFALACLQVLQRGTASSRRRPVLNGSSAWASRSTCGMLGMITRRRTGPRQPVRSSSAGVDRDDPLLPRPDGQPP
jgi:hypothetical protein